MAKAAKKTTAGTVKVTQVRSANNRPKEQAVVLNGLGLGKLHRTRELQDTPAVRGMIRKVQHLLKIEQ